MYRILKKDKQVFLLHPVNPIFLAILILTALPICQPTLRGIILVNTPPTSKP
jgi:hypothetical protein